MPLFDISSGIKAQHRSGAQPKDAYDLMRKIVVDFAKRGDKAVKWTEQAPPHKLRAQLSDQDGTNLMAEIDIADEGKTTRCDINIHGHVFLGGILGRIVSASTIKGKAQEKIKEMLDESFAGTPSSRAPLAAAATPKPTAPTTLPPGHPNAKTSPPLPQQAPASLVPSSAASSSMPTATRDPWQSVVDAVLSGARTVDPRALVAKAASAGAAVCDAGVDGALLQPVQVALVRALAKGAGKDLDATAAVRMLERIGAAPSSQGELASGANGTALKRTAAAYALTAAVGEAALKALDVAAAADGVDEGLKDLFEASYERVLGEKIAAHGASAVGDKLAQLREARDADLLSDAELLTLRERVLASL